MIFMSSDEHYFHKNIIQYSQRPFKDVEEMNKALIENHNSVVGVNDEVIHLGDFSMSNTYVKGILSQLNGIHILIPGNHDKCHPCHKKTTKTKAEYLFHGHVHTSWKTKENMINLGVDVWDYKPVSLNNVIKYIKDNNI